MAVNKTVIGMPIFSLHFKFFEKRAYLSVYKYQLSIVVYSHVFSEDHIQDSDFVPHHPLCFCAFYPHVPDFSIVLYVQDTLLLVNCHLKHL